MNITHINAFDCMGGAAKVAFRLAEDQFRGGHSSGMLVNFKKCKSAPFPVSEVFEKYANELPPLEKNGLQYYSFQLSHSLADDPLVIKSDILHLHNIHGGYFNPFSLSLLSMIKPVVWTLHDMHSITGHCAHSLDCFRWEEKCGECPGLKIYPPLPLDRTARLLKEKKVIYDNSFFNIVTPSFWLKSKLEKSILQEHYAEVIHNGIDTKIFRPLDNKEIKRKYKIPDGLLVVGCVAEGGIENDWKGGIYIPGILKDILVRFPNTVFLNIGSSSQSSHPNIINIPFVEDESMLSEIYSLLDVFLFTSIAENCPLVILEALSCGVPIVTFNTGGVPELVRSGTDGFVVAYKNTREAIQCLEAVLSDKEKRTLFGENARQNALKNFDHEITSGKYERIYQKTIDEYKSKRRNNELPVIPLAEVPEEIKTVSFLNSYEKNVSQITKSSAMQNENSGRLKISQKPYGKEKTGHDIKVSAIVSVYNSQKYIEGCMDDLIRQTLYEKNQLEIVVVNTGSQQNEEVVVKQFQEKYLNIKYIKIEQRETVYQAWNRGIKASSGKYITNANTDDRHRADALEIMADELDSNPDIALVYGDQFVTKIENETFDNHTEYGRFLWPEFDRIQLIHTSCCGPQPMWRRSLHDEFGYFLEDLKVAGDYEWWLRISEKYHLKHIDDVLGLYLISDGSIEHKETDACILETRKIREYYARKTGLRGLDYNTYSPTFLKINKNGLHDAALPLVSVIIPTYNRPQYLRQSIQSVLNQTYTNLEVLIINDAGCDVKSIVDEIGDKRVSYICHENNKGLAAARNTGIRNAKGKYIAYLDDDDIYYPHHISTLVNFLEAGPYRIAYTDAYRAIQELQNGKYVTVEKDIPFSRSFSRDMLLYLNIAPVQCFMHEKSICNELGLFDETLPAHEDWEYWLRLSRKNDFMHLTVLTSEFRQRTDYTNMTTTRHLGFYSSYRKVIHKYYFNSLGKSEIQNTQLKILNNFRRNAQNSGSLKKVANNIKVSIVIPVFNKVELTKKCLESLYENTPEELDFEVIIVDNASTDGTRQYLGFAQQCFSSLTYITNSENAGFAKANNLGISRSRGKYIVCLNNDTEPQPGWLEALVQIAENDKSVAAVGSKLLFPNGTIQHAGVIVAQKLNPDVEDEKFMPTHIHYGLSGDLPEAGFAKTYQVLTAASLLIRKDAFLQVGGFDEQYWNGYEDVDLCFKLSSKGWKLVYQPESIVIHHESQSGPERFSKNKENVRLLLSRWMGKIKPDYLINDKNKGILAGNGKIGLYTPPLENMPLSQNDNTKAKGPFVSIIVLTFNGLKYNKEFINSVLKFTKCPYELIVVDNASKDGTVEYLGKLGEKHPNIHVIYNEINLGFPAAVNQAIKAAAGNFVLVANNDIVVTENWLERMVEIGLSEPKIGIVGTISNAVSGVQIDKNAKYKTMPEMHRYAKKVRKENAGRYLEFPRVAFLCTLIKKEVIDALGGLDERFSPGNFEDDDFCLRAEKAGYKAIIAKDVFIHHYGSKSFKADGERKYAKRIETNKKKFVNKWGATIEEIWLEGKPVRERSLSYPIHSDEFLEKYERALVHFSDEEFELAEGALKRALEIYETEGRSDRLKEYANILDLYGNLYLLSEDPEKAKDFFERELKLEPESVSACLGLGEVFFAAELFHESKEMFQWAAKNGPVNKSAAAGLAKVNRKLGLADDDNSLIIENETRMNDAAGSSKSNIVNMDIKMNELLHKAEELIGQNKLDEAIELLYEVIRTDAKNVDALNDLAVVSILAGDFESAADFIGKAVKIDPSNDVAIENMNYLSRLIDEKMNQTENNSEIHLQENLTEDVKPAGRYADLLEKAETLIENNDLASARKVLETVLMMEEGNLDAMNDLSVIEIMEKNYPAAVELLERVIRLEPDNEVANENIQYLQKELNNL